MSCVQMQVIGLNFKGFPANRSANYTVEKQTGKFELSVSTQTTAAK